MSGARVARRPRHEGTALTGAGPMGGEGKIIEADETFIGRLEGQPKARAGFGQLQVNR
jgi:hypothetical protein